MKKKLLLTTFLLVGFSARLAACAVCAGGDNVQLAEASNSVLWALLALVGFIFLATGATAFFLWRKATAPKPPQLIESLNPQNAEV